MNSRHGVLLLASVLLTVILFNQGRRLFFPEESSPLVRPSPPLHVVELGAGFVRPGVYQFSDGFLPDGAIQLTDLDCVNSEPSDEFPEDLNVAGLRLDLFCNTLNELELSWTWMSADHRMALGVPLHPDRMTLSDWQALPGIGPRLAKRIEQYRQRNGDFENLNALRGVRGVGPKRIMQWRKFFHDDVMP